MKIIKINNEGELDEFLNNHEEGFIFRGQSDYKWKLESSHKRNNDNYNFNYVFEEKIKHMKDNGYHLKTDLEIMIEMQHYGLKTILIDFKSDIYVALWFATSDINNSKEDFSIFTFELNGNLRYEIDFKEKEKIYYCPLNNKRGFNQKSYFLLDNMNFKKSNKIIKYIVSSNLRINVENILFNRDISAISMFPNLKGLYLDFEKKSSIYWFDQGNKFFTLKKYKKAIEKYEKAIAIDPQLANTYLKKGNALFELKKYLEAIKEYDKAIIIDPQFEDAYYFKSFAFAKLKKYPEALEAINKALNLDPKNNEYKKIRDAILKDIK